MADRRTGSRLLRRVGAVVAVVGLLVGGVATVAGAVSAPVTEVIGSGDPVADAVVLSQRLFPEAGSAAAVVVIGAEAAADSLTASGLASGIGATFLVTAGDGLDPAVVDEIGRVVAEPRRIVVVGGPEAVSAEVVDALGASGSVERVAGADRFATAEAVARAFPFVGQTMTGRRVALVVNGAALIDAVTAGGVGVRPGVPVLLSDGAGVSTGVADVLAELEIDEVAVVGGPEVIASGVEDALRALGLEVVRVAGENRYGTAVAAWDYGATAFGAVTSTVVLGQGSVPERGDVVPTVLAGWYAGRSGAAFLLSGSLPAETGAWLRAHGAGIDRVVGVGGVPEATVREAADLVAAAEPGTSSRLPGPPRNISLWATMPPMGGAVTFNSTWDPPTDPGSPPFVGYTVEWDCVSGPCPGTMLYALGTPQPYGQSRAICMPAGTFTVTASVSADQSSSRSGPVTTSDPIQVVVPRSCF